MNAEVWHMYKISGTQAGFCFLMLHHQFLFQFLEFLFVGDVLKQ